VKKIDNKLIQVTLLIFGIFLLVATYFIYPKINQKKQILTEKEVEKIEIDEDVEGTSFTNVEYKGFTEKGYPYVVRAEKANMREDDQDILYMTNIYAEYYFKGGRVVKITSDFAKFNKTNGDISFQDNVKMIDGDNNKLAAENLDMLISKDYASAYDDVEILTKDGQSLNADKIFFDVIKKTFKISMFSKNEKVKVKLIE